FRDYGLADAPDSYRTVFDDAAIETINQGTAPFRGTFRPQQPLAVFVGKGGTNVNGTWKLHVFDSFFSDVGTIQCWSLFLYPAMCTDGGTQCPGADLALGMTASPEPVFLGSNLVYTISLTNIGPNTAKNTVISQVL